MHSTELEAYELRDKEKASRIAYALAGQPRPEVQPRDFYPEIRSDGPFTCPNLHPFWVCLPYYKSVIFNVYPFGSESILQNAHGVTVRQLLSLYEQGKVTFVLAGLPSYYDGLDYLDPILTLEPPTYPTRMEAFCLFQHGWESFRRWIIEAHELFSGRLERLYRITGVSTSIAAFEGSFVGALANLQIMGFKGLADAIKTAAVTIPDIAAWYAEVYHDLLCSPRTNCLGGCHITQAEYVRLASEVSGLSGRELDGRFTDCGPSFPVEVGQMLTEQYELVRPSSLGHALEVYPDYAEARIAFLALAEAVDTSRYTDIQSRIEEVHRAFEAVAKIHKRKKTVSLVQEMTGVVGAAVSGLRGDVSGFLAALGFGVLATDAAREAVSSMSTLGVKRNLVTLYNFSERVGATWQRGGRH